MLSKMAAKVVTVVSLIVVVCKESLLAVFCVSCAKIYKSECNLVAFTSVSLFPQFARYDLLYFVFSGEQMSLAVFCE